MKTLFRQWRLGILAALALLVGFSPRAEAAQMNGVPFFAPEVSLGADTNGFPVYYLSYFQTFTYDSGNNLYVYKYSFGWLYYFGGTTTDTNDAYFYDFTAGDNLYTSANLYPYFYSFNLNTFLYYFEGSSPRTFYDFASQASITY